MENFTLNDLKKAVSLLKENRINGDYVMRIHPDKAHEAFDLGLDPMCVLNADTKFIECETRCGGNNEQT